MSTRPPRPLSRTRIAAASAIALLAVVLSGCLTADQQSTLTLINKSRADVHLAALTPRDDATSKAQAWSAHMAKTGVLEHTGGGSTVDPGTLKGWCAYGENVGMGSSVTDVHAAFMRSAPHKANILGRYDKVGIGVVKSGRTYWITEIFLRSC